jgi:hypothetical protein
MSAREPDRLARFSHWLGNLVPDATSASVILLAVVVVAALASGNSPSTVGDAYYRGLCPSTSRFSSRPCRRLSPCGSSACPPALR